MLDGLTLTSPPVAFLVVLAAAGLLYLALSPLSLRGASAAGLCKPYACGEDAGQQVQPDYGQFFPFAFFFTILHVVALMVTTVPTDSVGSLSIAVLYIVGAVTGLTVLYKR